MEASLPYHEPSITIIAILSGFLLLLNLVNYGLDKLAYCGLIGQVALGIAWGTPGAKWLSREVEDAVVQLGYLGLILLVFEGGLSTSFKSLKANLGLSSVVATTGILIPIGFSFAVMPMLNATPLQAFSAGAALCSTSLGTTFTILGTSGLSATRLGVVLTSAAMMDDIVGLIMVQVISNLGGDSFDAITVVRPVMVSLGFAIVIPILCRFIVVPVTIRLNSFREANPTSNISKALSIRQTAFVIHTAYLLGIVVGATFAGTSSLLAAYIAGATISWWDSDVPHLEAQDANATGSHGIEESRTAESETIEESAAVPADQRPLPTAMKGGSGAEIFHCYYEPALQSILKPFFFASIGFSVPIAKLFTGPIVWRGVIYTILMIIAKLACGLWLVSFTNPYRAFARLVQRFSPKVGKSSKSLVPGTQCADTTSTPCRQEDITTERVQQCNNIPLEPTENTNTTQTSPQARNSMPKPEKSISLYPACIVGVGMVARGEIGYLISALAESKGIFGRSADGQPSELFLIITWAITLCTIIGPISVGLIVNRVRQLESGSLKVRGESKRNVLGAWGVS
ncbi:Sodium/hydrogen exchanger family-domain-containing protein [Fusarium acuminatum]|uniref:Sodium/hydrogen exchanger family-domain-containing protein n=1 Tax=Fusarium acuminatum TaxID=5515 RepID=A0ABZ2X4U0_9HYPO